MVTYRKKMKVDASIENVKPENYKNYFEYVYRPTKKQNIHENINYINMYKIE